jgi:hypothetical protein
MAFGKGALSLLTTSSGWFVLNPIGWVISIAAGFGQTWLVSWVFSHLSVLLLPSYTTAVPTGFVAVVCDTVGRFFGQGARAVVVQLLVTPAVPSAARVVGAWICRGNEYCMVPFDKIAEWTDVVVGWVWGWIGSLAASAVLSVIPEPFKSGIVNVFETLCNPYVWAIIITVFVVLQGAATFAFFKKRIFKSGGHDQANALTIIIGTFVVALAAVLRSLGRPLYVFGAVGIIFVGAVGVALAFAAWSCIPFSPAESVAMLQSLLGADLETARLDDSEREVQSELNDLVARTADWIKAVAASAAQRSSLQAAVAKGALKLKLKQLLVPVHITERSAVRGTGEAVFLRFAPTGADELSFRLTLVMPGTGKWITSTTSAVVSVMALLAIQLFPRGDTLPRNLTPAEFLRRADEEQQEQQQNQQQQQHQQQHQQQQHQQRPASPAPARSPQAQSQSPAPQPPPQQSQSPAPQPPTQQQPGYWKQMRQQQKQQKATAGAVRQTPAPEGAGSAPPSAAPEGLGAAPAGKSATSSAPLPTYAGDCCAYATTAALIHYALRLVQLPKGVPSLASWQNRKWVWAEGTAEVMRRLGAKAGAAHVKTVLGNFLALPVLASEPTGRKFGDFVIVNTQYAKGAAATAVFDPSAKHWFAAHPVARDDEHSNWRLLGPSEGFKSAGGRPNGAVFVWPASELGGAPPPSPTAQQSPPPSPTAQPADPPAKPAPSPAAAQPAQNALQQPAAAKPAAKSSSPPSPTSAPQPQASAMATQQTSQPAAQQAQNAPQQTVPIPAPKSSAKPASPPSPAAAAQPLAQAAAPPTPATPQAAAGGVPQQPQSSPPAPKPSLDPPGRAARGMRNPGNKCFAIAAAQTLYHGCPGFRAVVSAAACPGAAPPSAIALAMRGVVAGLAAAPAAGAPVDASQLFSALGAHTEFAAPGQHDAALAFGMISGGCGTGASMGMYMQGIESIFARRRHLRRAIANAMSRATVEGWSAAEYAALIAADNDVSSETAPFPSVDLGGIDNVQARVSEGRSALNVLHVSWTAPRHPLALSAMLAPALRAKGEYNVPIPGLAVGHQVSVEAQFNMVLTALPQTLVIVLQRGKKNAAGHLSKNKGRVRVEALLDLAPLLHPKARKQETTYVIRAVLAHCGEQLDSGHYAVLAAGVDGGREMQWINDDHVSTTTLKNFNDDTRWDAYVVVYEQVRPPPPPPAPTPASVMKAVVGEEAPVPAPAVQAQTVQAQAPAATPAPAATSRPLSPLAAAFESTSPSTAAPSPPAAVPAEATVQAPAAAPPAKKAAQAPAAGAQQTKAVAQAPAAALPAKKVAAQAPAGGAPRKTILQNPARRDELLHHLLQQRAEQEEVPRVDMAQAGELFLCAQVACPNLAALKGNAFTNLALHAVTSLPSGLTVQEFRQRFQRRLTPAQWRCGKTIAIRRRHLNALHAMKRALELEPSLHSRSFAEAVVTVYRARAEERSWRAATLARELANFAGALADLPLYSNSPIGFKLSESPFVTDAMKAAQLAANEELVDSQPAASVEELLLAVALAPDTAVKVALVLTWCCAGRVADVLKLQRKDVELQQDFAQSGKMRVMFVRGKGARLADPYTVPTITNQEWRDLLSTYLAKVQPDEWLFPGWERTFGALVNIALRTANPNYTVRAIRRGALQAMAATGAEHKDLMKFSGHKCEGTLLRYLNWGRSSVAMHRGAYAAAPGLGVRAANAGAELTQQA